MFIDAVSAVADKNCYIFFEMLAQKKLSEAEMAFKGHSRSSVMTDFNNISISVPSNHILYRSVVYLGVGPCACPHFCMRENFKCGKLAL